jgi:hypothetical protein
MCIAGRERKKKESCYIDDGRNKYYKNILLDEDMKFIRKCIVILIYDKYLF